MRTFRFIFMFAVAAVVVLLPSIVMGQPCECPPIDVNVSTAEAVQEWWQVLLVHLMDAVAPIVIAVLGTLVSIAVRKWGKKLDAEKQDAVIKLTNDFIAAGIGFAEEQGRKALKDGAERTASADKMGSAMEFIQERLEASGLSRMAEVELTKLIEARLASERARPDGVVPGDALTPKNGTPTPVPGEGSA